LRITNATGDFLRDASAAKVMAPISATSGASAANPTFAPSAANHESADAGACSHDQGRVVVELANILLAFGRGQQATVAAYR
jgi:hypothetical protein